MGAQSRQDLPSPQLFRREESGSSLRVSSSDHNSHRHTRRSPPPYSTTIFRHHIPPPNSATIFRRHIPCHHKPSYSAIAFLPRHRSDQFPAVVRVRVELLSPSYFFLLSFFV